MKTISALLLSSALLSAHTPEDFTLAASTPVKAKAPETPKTPLKPAKQEAQLNGFVRINSTIQSFNAGQPWQRNNPVRRRGLGALISSNEILTTAEMVADQTYLELQSSNSSERVSAKVIAIDYKANLALLAPEKEDSFLGQLQPLTLGSSAKIGDSVKVWQVESNGTTINTTGIIRGVDTASTFLPGFTFLIYEVKASMQSATSSFTLPVTRNGKLLGILTSYNSEDQISEIIAPEIVNTFLEDARDGSYEGFPTLGIATQRTEDQPFRDYLDLDSEDGGLYISLVKEGSPAAQAKVQKGDVLLAFDGHDIDRRGFFQHPDYGPLPWTVLVRGKKNVGDQASITILREGTKQDLTATLAAPEEPLVPRHIHDSPPPFLIKGGLVFQELSRSYLQAYGDNWDSRAPIALMHVMENQSDYEEGRNRVVFLARVIPNPATIGYDQLNGVIVESANGQPVKDLADLAKHLETAPENGIHAIKINGEPDTLYLDARFSDMVDQQLLQSGLPTLSRLE